MTDTRTEAHRLGYALGKAAGDAFAYEIKEYVQRLEAERDALRAENDLLKSQLEAAQSERLANPGLLDRWLAQREPSSDP